MSLTVVVLLLGCQADEPIDADGGDDAGNGDDGAGDDSAGHDGGGAEGGGDGSDGYVPTSFTIRAAVGVDGPASTLHTVVIDGKTSNPWVEIATYDDAGTNCSVFFVMENAPAVVLQVWNFEDATKDIETTSMAHVGFSIPKDAALYSSGKGCDTWDPEPY